METKFCDYLTNIGLIDNKISNNIKTINKEVSKSRKEFSFTDSFFISLMHYFNNLTINQKKYMCFSLPLRFILSRQRELNQKLKSILLKKNLREKIIKLKYLLRWLKSDKFNFKIENNLNYDDKLNNNLLLDEDSGSIALEDFMLENKRTSYKKKENNNKTKNYSYEKNKKALVKKNNSYNKSRTNTLYNNKIIAPLTTSDRKELLQLSECTFKPTINTTNNSFRNTNRNSNKKMTFMKLYQDSEKYKIKKRLKQLEFEKLINNELTFKPHLCQTPKSISNFKFDSFEERQKNFINNKRENANKLKIDIERNTASKCSFIPKVNKTMTDYNLSSVGYIRRNLTNFNSATSNPIYNLTNEENKQNTNQNLKTKSNSKNKNNYIGESYYSLSTAKTVPAHLRLYNDSQRRNTSYIQKENEYNKLINDMANRTSRKFMKVNYDKLFDLYENKVGKSNMEKTRQKVEKEEGVTFMPELYLNNKYIDRICNNFYERNQNCKKNCLFKKYERFEEDRKKNEKKYTDEQKKKIIQNIVERLYKEPMNKNNKKNNMTDCNKYVKNLSYIDSSKNNAQNNIPKFNIN